MKIIYHNTRLAITADNAKYKTENVTMDSRAKQILGLALFSKRLDQVDLRGTVALKLGGVEVFQENTDAKMFTTNASVAVKDKFFMFEKPMDVGNLQIELEYKSTDNPLIAFAPHDVTLCLILDRG